MTTTREITAHRDGGGLNDALTITADERSEINGKSSHHYEILWNRPEGTELAETIDFQKGPVKEAGINGVTIECLIAICLDRLEGFQTSDYACRDNAIAITKLEEALMRLQRRTRDRVARGVLGTYSK